jgi:glyoxylase-like metal-dependent hydrolase (beta-lactamase superfamily II)
VVPVDNRKVLVTGQELDVEGGSPDVANCLLHLSGETLVIVDTGATVAFPDAIRRAADSLGAWTQLLLLTTHGHTDRVGNKDLVDELDAAPAVRRPSTSSRRPTCPRCVTRCRMP